MCVCTWLRMRTDMTVQVYTPMYTPMYAHDRTWVCILYVRTCRTSRKSHKTAFCIHFWYTKHDFVWPARCTGHTKLGFVCAFCTQTTILCDFAPVQCMYAYSARSHVRTRLCTCACMYVHMYAPLCTVCVQLAATLCNWCTQQSVFIVGTNTWADNARSNVDI